MRAGWHPEDPECVNSDPVSVSPVLHNSIQVQTDLCHMLSRHYVYSISVSTYIITISKLSNSDFFIGIYVSI